MDFIEKRDNIIEKAIMFATLAHEGDIRKSEPDKPKIIHPLAVAQILIEYGADNNVIAAGILHDVWEGTKYTLEDIKKVFGEDIAHLVYVASKLELREKLVPLADKINNIESLERLFKQKGCVDFSAFKREKEKQEWYYRSIYESLIYNEDKENPLFARLERSINNVFGRTMEEYKEAMENQR